MNESKMWQTIRPVLVKADLDPVRIENALEPGTPDVNYTKGWIELKYIAKWPKSEIPLKIPHFTPEQRAWIARRRCRSKYNFVLLLVEKDWMLFDGGYAVIWLGHHSKQQLLDNCIEKWKNVKSLITLSEFLS